MDAMHASFWHTLPMSEQREQAAEPTVVETGAGQDIERRTNGEKRPREIGGPKGPEPTRFGDWERGGRCIDF
jgi:hypothetical protein